MFSAQIDLPRVRLAGCPDSGIPAIDFRRANGLPEAPTSEIAIKASWADQEDLIRRYPAEYANCAGDLVVTTKSDSNSHCSILTWAGETSRGLAEAINTSDTSGQSLFGSPIPADLARPFFVNPAPEDFARLLDYFLARAAAARAEKKARDEALAAEEKAAKAERERRDAEVAAAKKAELETLAAWTREHGSELARLRLEEGYDCWVSAARVEYADAVAAKIAEVSSLPLDDGDLYEQCGSVKTEPRKCPEVAEIKALRVVKAALPDGCDAKIVWSRYTGGDLDEDIARAEIVLTIHVPGAGEEERLLVVSE